MKIIIGIYDSITNNILKLSVDTNFYIYLCGPTVYNDVHIGNLRPVIITDVLVRFLKQYKINVIYWQNITDINEKLIKSAKIEKSNEKKIGQKYSQKYLELLKKINIIMPSNIIYVSKNIENIINYIKKLEKANFTYSNETGVYFNVDKLSEYYVLSNNIKENIQGKNDMNKQKTYDFALWKKSNINSFESNYGPGRPGWHTECAYFCELLAKKNHNQIDIHIGGKDLIFPHNENEIAQHKALYNNNIAKIWLHIGQVNINNAKMSKSLNNFILAKDFIQKYSSNILKLCLFSAKYTKPISIDDKTIQMAEKLDKKINNYICKFCNESCKKLDLCKIKLETSLYNDFANLNFSRIIAQCQEMIKKLNTKYDQETFSQLYLVMNLLGLKYHVYC